MKKVGLVTIFQVPNYGSVLQAYATQCLIEKLGYKCIIINYRYPNLWHISKDPKRKASFKTKVARILCIKSQHRKIHKLHYFCKKHLHLSKEYKSLEELKKSNWDSYNVIITGSDQVWNPRFTLADSVFMLSFLPDCMPRISIASSFSFNIPKELIDKYKTYLEKYNYISVRESNGKNIIENDLHINKEVKILLDPTLMLNKDEWMRLTKSHQTTTNNKYILLYLLTYSFESRPYVFEVVKYFQEKYKYKVIAISGYTPKNHALGIKMINKTDTGVKQFINLFSNASIVITTSFHGTAFAINFGTPLISIIPPNDKGDDRQVSLLKSLDLEQCIIPIGSNLETIDPFYNPNQILEKLNRMRYDSLNWIKDSLLHCI